MTHPRLNPYEVAPQTMVPMVALERSLREDGLEQSLVELVKIRASQINGCAYCLHMHTGDARKAGEAEERIYLLDGWRESSLYSPRERAALAWAEALTLVHETRAPDAVYEELDALFDDEEKVKLTLLIATINAWNRIAVGFRSAHPARQDRKAAA